MSTAPIVSVCLPNLCNRRYLPERIDTIIAQTFADWELVVFDNHSDDGAWEYLCERAKTEPRMRLAQAAREGMYANWNNCLAAARGRYIYFATSDDTMASDCLEKLVAALDTNPNCGLAHCPLRVIDQHGVEFDSGWSTKAMIAQATGDWLARPHVRRAPFDGLLHLSGESVYISITQLLIRRTTFDRIGNFATGWGSLGDFEWEARASLLFDVVHVPDTWGGWRRHAEQATAFSGYGTPQYRVKIEQMLAHAVDRVANDLPPATLQLLRKHGLFFFSRRQALSDALKRSPKLVRPFRLAWLALQGSDVALERISTRLSGRGTPLADAGALARKWTRDLGLDEVIRPLEIVAGGDGGPPAAGTNPTRSGIERNGGAPVLVERKRTTATGRATIENTKAKT